MLQSEMKKLNRFKELHCAPILSTFAEYSYTMINHIIYRIDNNKIKKY